MLKAVLTAFVHNMVSRGNITAAAGMLLNSQNWDCYLHSSRPVGLLTIDAFYLAHIKALHVAYL